MPIQVKQGERGPTGKARVSISEKKVKVTFTDGDVYDLLPEDCPKYLTTYGKSGNYGVSLDRDGVKMYAARPIGGTHVGKFFKFGHKEGEPPAPKVVPGGVRTKKDGTRFTVDDTLQFTALFVITSQEYKDFELSMMIPYAFKEFSGEAGICGKGMKKLEEFLKAVGIDFETDTIPFSDNVLPALEKIIKAKNVSLIFELSPEGYIDKMMKAPK